MNALIAETGPITKLTAPTSAVKPTCKGAMRDYEIRHTLRRVLSDAHTGEPDTLLIDELALCQGEVRVDVAVVNGFLSGYEIKSERDTLARLPGQVDIYSQILDFAAVVCSEKHLDKLEGIVPHWWGILGVTNRDGQPCLHELRAAKRNENVHPYALAQLLWREEAMCLLRSVGAEKGIISKPRRFVWRRVAEAVPFDLLSSFVRQKLKDRGDWRSAQSRTSDGANCPLAAM